LPIGAHVVTPRRGYTHHGIYVGRGRVVQYGGLSRGLRSGPVKEVSLSHLGTDGRSGSARGNQSALTGMRWPVGPARGWGRIAITCLRTTVNTSANGAYVGTSQLPSEELARRIGGFDNVSCNRLAGRCCEFGARLRLATRQGVMPAPTELARSPLRRLFLQPNSVPWSTSTFPSCRKLAIKEIAMSQLTTTSRRRPTRADHRRS